jgi:ferredoxin
VSQWRISVDGSRCIGSGLCAATAPATFRLVGATAEPVAELATPDAAVTEAAQMCPVEAVTVRDGTTGQLVSPAD